MLRQLPKVKHPDLLVGADLGDDAGVVRLDRNRALVQTVDFFTPIVDDPRLYGQIAAANSLSDVYAMGGRPLTAMNLLGVPEDRLSPEAMKGILSGGSAIVRQAGCLLVGGHTMRNAEPFYGLSVTGLVSPRRLITNSQARPGDLLVLTKPIGTGIITTAIREQLASPRLARLVGRWMCRLNSVGAELGERGLVCAGVDITGFGLVCHLGAICRSSGVGAELVASQVPVMSREIFGLIARGCVPAGTRKNLAFANDFTLWDDIPEPEKTVLSDAQTSGGLLLCVPPRKWASVRRVLEAENTRCAAVIGKIVKSSRPTIRVLR